ncbi:hypothetical protein MVEN_00800700 [Mycena venus]|uniref:Uncharacterized protein n=1 Tax=Mycena venus TaxID=2733690 RepID=A0A8H6YKI4_9AGAR|nr:hypothetical protein MVEN_00800700 [Mycena venus]
MRFPCFRCRRRYVLIGLALLIFISISVLGAYPELRQIIQHVVRVNYNYYIADRGPWGTDDGPPKYLALRQWEATLPQHDLSLPPPEGKHGRYVKFSNQERGLGWNNCFNEVSDEFKADECAPCICVWTGIRFPGILLGTSTLPVAQGEMGRSQGGPFEPGDPAPRAVSEAWFDVVCPRAERHYIYTRDVKPAVAEASGIDVFAHWQKVLQAPQRCVEIVVADKKESFPQTFDLVAYLPLSGSLSNRARGRRPQRLSLRATRPSSPHPATRNPFERMLALHLRRGDYEGHCRGLAYINAAFYSWNQFSHLPDRLVSEPDAPGKDERFLARCWPDHARVVEKVAEARRDYLTHAQSMNGTLRVPTLDILYVLTNEKSASIEELRNALQLDGWTMDVSMAVDMEIARRSAVFVGNGWSSFTSNIVYQRLVDNRDPISIRFT